jgi:membrane protein YdbS with pleckstrin-like domain
MKCPVCDANADSEGAFCQHCGAKLPRSESVGDAETQSPPTESPTERPQLDPSTGSSSRGGRRRGVVDVPEETLWEGTFSYKAMIGLAVLCGVATIVLFVVALAYFEGLMRTILLIVIVVMWVLLAARTSSRRLGISYKLTNHMFYHRHGVLTRVTDRIELIEVHDVTYEQGVSDRLVNTGRIKIASSDRTDPIFYLLGVEDVERVAKLIDTARRDEQVRRGRRIEFSHADGGM